MNGRLAVHIISHTHWDREWFLNSPYTNEWLVEFFDSLFAMLEKEPDYRFVLDGQILMIEDYLDELQKCGRNRSAALTRLSRHVGSGRLLVGPYYLQPDWQLVSGESLIRNLQIGMRTARGLGGCLRTGWLLDNFGQISQAAQIHHAFGLEGIFLWRGVEMDPEEVRSEFLWESPDGSCLPAVYLLDSYRNAMRLSEYPEIFAVRIRSEVDKLKPFATTSNILLMNGYDQEMRPDDILPLVRSARIQGVELMQSTPGEFLDAVQREKPVLPRLRGGLYSGRFISVFPGVLSSRMYLKRMNHRCQRLLEAYAEPLSAVTWAWGLGPGDGQLEEIWKLLLKNHPHDSICGVSIDDVHTDMEQRFDAVAGQAERFIGSCIGQLSAAVETGWIEGAPGRPDTFLVFNPCPYTREQLVTVQGIAGEHTSEAVDGKGEPLEVQRGRGGKLHVRLRDIPGCGYTTIRLRRGLPSRRAQATTETADCLRVDEKGRTVENGYFVLQLDSDGSLQVFDKGSGATYRGLGVVEDGGDAGDTYTYSPPPRNMRVYSRGVAAEVDFLESGPLLCVVRIKTDLSVPQALSAHRKSRSPDRLGLPVISYLRIEAGSPLIRFKTLVKNTVKDHRLRVLFPSGVETAMSCAETQFDVVTRPIRPQPYENGRLSAELKRVLIGAREPQPVTTFAQGAFVDLSDGNRGLAMINAGLPEYEVIPPDNTVALTLFRSVGWLAREGLLSRTGDAGPQILCPEAQCLREMEFDYAVCLHPGDWLKGRVHRWAERFNNECMVLRAEGGPGWLPAEAGLLGLRSRPDVVRVTALKRSDDGQAIVLRCHNPSAEPAVATIEAASGITAAFYVDMQEEVKGRIELPDSNRLSIRVEPKKIVALRFELDRPARPEGRDSRKDVSFDRDAKSGWRHAVPPPVDFASYPAAPVIDRADIEAEQERRQGLERELETARSLAAALERGLQQLAPGRKHQAQRELELVRSDIATLERRSLECELSLLLAKKKWNELNPGRERIPPFREEEYRSSSRDIGLRLNQARIRKRTYDYLAEHLRL